MYRNYFLFAEQVRWLRTNICDSKIETCFTHRKSELVLQIHADANYFLRLGLQTSLPYILLSTARNIKEAKTEFFGEISGQIIKNIEIQPFDKLVTISCQSYSLKICFYGSHPNVIFYDSHGNKLDKFKKNEPETSRKHDIVINPFDCDDSCLSTLISEDQNWTLEKFLSHHIGGFNFLLSRECCFRTDLKSDMNIRLLQKSDLHKLSDSIKQVAIETQKARPKIYFFAEIPKHLSIISLNHLQQNYVPTTFPNVNEAWKTFLRLRFESKKLEKINNINRNAIKKKINTIEKSLAKIKEFEELEKRKKLAELKGNLLLTFISDVQRGAKFVKLKNIFSPEQEEIEIKLNPNKSIQENAQKYFRKFKDIESQKNKIDNKKDMLQRDLREIRILEKKSNSVKSIKEASKLRDILIQRKLIQPDTIDESNRLSLDYAFKRILLENKWEIYIGKNDKNNDLLTFKFAHKFDLWFHAQGVPGSHVIIRLSGKNEAPPAHIIEQVAAITAYHSDSKHSTTVPVIYTPVRYVRKARKAKAGTVSVLQHRIIFVEPKNL